MRSKPSGKHVGFWLLLALFGVAVLVCFGVVICSFFWLFLCTVAFFRDPESS